MDSGAALSPGDIGPEDVCCKRKTDAPIVDNSVVIINKKVKLYSSTVKSTDISNSLVKKSDHDKYFLAGTWPRLIADHPPGAFSPQGRSNTA